MYIICGVQEPVLKCGRLPRTSGRVGLSVYFSDNICRATLMWPVHSLTDMFTKITEMSEQLWITFAWQKAHEVQWEELRITKKTLCLVSFTWKAEWRVKWEISTSYFCFAIFFFSTEITCCLKWAGRHLQYQLFRILLFWVLHVFSCNALHHKLLML